MLGSESDRYSKPRLHDIDPGTGCIERNAAGLALNITPAEVFRLAAQEVPRAHCQIDLAGAVIIAHESIPNPEINARTETVAGRDVILIRGADYLFVILVVYQGSLRPQVLEAVERIHVGSDLAADWLKPDHGVHLREIVGGLDACVDIRNGHREGLAPVLGSVDVGSGINSEHHGRASNVLAGVKIQSEAGFVHVLTERTLRHGQSQVEAELSTALRESGQWSQKKEEREAEAVAIVFHRIRRVVIYGRITAPRLASGPSNGAAPCGCSDLQCGCLTPVLLVAEAVRPVFARQCHLKAVEMDAALPFPIERVPSSKLLGQKGAKRV